MDRDNYYVLLELPFDPPVTDNATIRAAIQKKRQAWIRLQDVPGNQSTALYYMSCLADIERVMTSPVLRAEEAQAAVALRELLLRQFEAELRIGESKGYLTPREAAALTAKYSAYGIGEEDLRPLAKVPITAEPPMEKEEEAGEVLDRLSARNIHRQLALLKKEDLYEFLELPPYSSIQKLRTAAEEKGRAAAAGGEKNAQVTAIQELEGICQQLFANFDAKQRYDRYLRMGAYPAVGELLDEEYNRSRFVGPEVLLRIVNFAVEKYGCKILEAEEYIRRYCRAYDIPLDSQAHMIDCPSCHNKTNREGLVCAVCAAPLRGTCPNCATEFAGGPSVCDQCGFAIADMAKALPYMSDAETAMLDSNWSLAQRNIGYAEHYWPGHASLESLRQRARQLEERYAAFIDNIEDAVRQCQYYAARELIEDAEGRRMRLPESLTGHVRKTVAGFERKMEAMREKPEQADYDTLYALLTTVSDSMELSRMLSAYPPEPVEMVTARLMGGKVRIDWRPSPASGMISYILVRKANSPSLTAYDGDILFDGMGNFYEDTGIEPLERYFYSVYVRRGNTFSAKAGVAGPIVLLPEVENLRIVPTDAGARLSWDFNPHLREVEIWRKLGGDRPLARGDGTRVENPRLDGFSDSRLRNDTDYWYFVVAVYLVGGARVYARGVAERVVPHKLMAPIDQLDVVRVANAEDEYVVNWHNSRYSDVLVLASPKKPEHAMGDIVPMTALLAQYRNLDMHAKTPESARVKFAFNGGAYLFAVSVSGPYATMGEAQYLVHVPKVENLGWDKQGNDILLQMAWPPEIDEVLMAWRFDEYPQAPGEPGTTYLTCTREQYEAEGGLLLKEPEKSLYYVQVFSVFATPEGEKVYSAGVEAKVDLTPLKEICYEIKYTRQFFTAAYTVSLTVSAEEEFVLPKAVIVGKIGRLPLRKTDGMPLFEIEKETRVGNAITFEYRTSLLPKDLHVKMFLRDEGLYSRYRLVPLTDLRLT